MDRDHGRERGFAMSPSRVLGFDREIQLAWLDRAAEVAARGASDTELRANLDELLAGRFGPGGYGGARGKTLTVLMRIWGQKRSADSTLRAHALRLLATLETTDVLPFHWGMALLAYPFFRDGVAMLGRLFRLQGEAHSSELARRLRETWGQRTTVVRATSRLLYSMENWQVVQREDKNLFSPAAPQAVEKPEVARWLMAAAMRSAGRRMALLKELLSDPALFPFRLSVRAGHLRGDPFAGVRHMPDGEVAVELSTA